MVWDKTRLVQALKKLHKQGADLSYNALAASQQSLVSAAAYHFGSYRKAIERAGIPYGEVARRPRWSKPSIIAVLKQASRDGEDLSWSSVTKRRDELGKAAFASLQPRLFGSWDKALHAAGLAADNINRYRKWDKTSIVNELRSRSRGADPLNSGTVQKRDPGLHAAAVRHFGSYEKALRAAKLDPQAVRRRRVWSKADVASALRTLHRAGKPLSDAALRKEDAALYAAAVRIFGSFAAAKAAAGKRGK